MEFFAFFRHLLIILIAVSLASIAGTPAAQESLADGARRKGFDQLLDLYVRNGDVYYRALKVDRGKLDQNRHEPRNEQPARAEPDVKQRREREAAGDGPVEHEPPRPVNCDGDRSLGGERRHATSRYHCGTGTRRSPTASRVRAAAPAGSSSTTLARRAAAKRHGRTSCTTLTIS